MGPSPRPKGSNGVNVSYWGNLYHPVPPKKYVEKCGKPIGVDVFFGKMIYKMLGKTW
jgi:hypothetical protein